MNALARYIVTGFLGVLLGVFVTLGMTGKHDDAVVVDEARQVVQKTAEANVDAVFENAKIVRKLEEQNITADAVKQEILNELAPQKEIVYVRVNVPGIAEAQLCPPVHGESVLPLSVGTVRLLNGLRAARTVDLTAPATGESQASAGVTVAQFVDNDTDVVKLYNELATVHDELVGEVITYMQKQADAR